MLTLGKYTLHHSQKKEEEQYNSNHIMQSLSVGAGAGLVGSGEVVLTFQES
jgi:hypothetical protein